MRRQERRRRPDIDGSVLRWPGATAKFALFAEVLWTGILMAIVCIPVVTWPAAVAAGSAHLRRFLHAEATPAAAFFHDVRSALPGGVLVGIPTTALGALATVNVALALGGAVPGAAAGAAVAAAIAAAALVVATVAASVWSEGTPWRELLRLSPRLLAADPGGAVFTVVALGMATVIAWQFLPLAIPALGLVAFALVAISERRMARLEAAAAAMP